MLLIFIACKYTYFYSILRVALTKFYSLFLYFFEILNHLVSYKYPMDSNL